MGLTSLNDVTINPFPKHKLSLQHAFLHLSHYLVSGILNTNSETEMEREGMRMERGKNNEVKEHTSLISRYLGKHT